MEEILGALLGLLVEGFGAVCLDAACNLVAVVVVDGLAGLAAYKRKQAAERGQPQSAWARAFWVLAPPAVIVTATLLVSVLYRLSR